MDNGTQEVATTNAANDPDRRVSGVILSKVNRQHLMSELLKREIHFDPNSPTEILVGQMAAHVAKTTAKGHFMTCDPGCQGDSGDVGYDSCPFCGANEADAPQPTQTAPSQPAKVEAPEPSASASTEPTEAPKKRGRPRKNPTAPTNGNGSSTALAKVEEPAKEVTAHLDAAKPLDESVQKILRLYGEEQKNRWHVGQELERVHREKLWQLRKTEEGKSAYKGGFNQWVESELGLSSDVAYALIDVSKSFTADQVALWGYTKLAYLVRAPTKDQQKLLEEGIAKGASIREIRKLVTEARKAAGHTRGAKETGRGSGTAKASEAASAANKAKASSKVTVATTTRTFHVDMLAGPTGKQHAATLKDLTRRGPGKSIVGSYEFDNNVVLRLELTSEKGKINIACKLSREKE
jgi:hypothetical protein